jgi:ferredoxin
MKIIVNPAACDGFGYCAEILPELIALDEWGFPIISGSEVSEELLEEAQRAVRFCPRRALEWRPTPTSLNGAAVEPRLTQTSQPSLSRVTRARRFDRAPWDGGKSSPRAGRGT